VVRQTFHVKQLLLTLMLGVSVGVGVAASPRVAAPQKVEFNSLEESHLGGPTKLTGYLFKPENLDPSKLSNAVVLAHGCSGLLDNKGKLRAGIAAWAERFVAKGWVAVAVDSFNPRGEKEVCTQKDRPILESRERPRDVYGALAFLTMQPYIQKDNVFLMGFSNGATGTLYAIEADGKPLELAKAAKISFRAALAFYPGCASATKRNLKPAIPLGIFMGELDDWTPSAPCKSLVENARAAGSDVRIHLYPNAYHGFDVPGAEVRVRKDVRMKASPQLANGVHVGGSDEARAAAIKDVDIFIDRVLKKVPPLQAR
jgi:dienelactone hydrolase